MTTLDDLAASGFVTDGWERWQQGHCGGYAAAMLLAFPHLRLGGIDFDNDTDEDGNLYDNPGHYVAHDDTHAYDSAGVHPLPYCGVHGDGRWLPDLGDPDDYGLSETYGECGDYDDAERADALEHATRHDLLPVLDAGSNLR